MNLIVSVDKNWAIGYQNKLLVRIPGDMKNFRRLTTDNVIVMGRKTLESFPQGQPLSNRVNIVLTKNKDYQVKGAVVVHSMEELMEELKRYEDKQICGRRGKHLPPASALLQKGCYYQNRRGL